jgi:subtilisin family serine protease
MKVRPRDGRARRARRLLSLCLSLLVVSAVAPFAPLSGHAARQDAAGAAKGERAEFVPGEALVRFRSEAAAEAASAAPATIRIGSDADGVTPDRLLAPDIVGGDPAQTVVSARVARFDGSDLVPGLRLTEFSTADREHTLEATAALNRRADVLYAEPNYVWRAKATPNDPLFVPNAPGGSSLGQYGMQRISAPAAWDTTTGSESVVVAVIDTGVDLQHPDLAANAWRNPGETGTDAQGNNRATNVFDDDGNGFADDVNGWDFTPCTFNSTTTPAVCGDNTVFDNVSDDDHGTHVAGTIGARGNNGQGVTGVNWQVSIMSVKVLRESGGDTADIIRGYNYVHMMRQRGVNVRVTNNSYGGPGFSQSALDAINRLNEAGILFVAAAGNDARDNFSIGEFPANYNAPNLIAVASTNTSTPDGLSSFSNFSSRLVSMGAPGSSILSTVPTGIDPANPYRSFSGTSMATPHVAGAAALILSDPAVNPNISVANLRGALAFTGDRLAALENNTTTGRRLNARAALDAARVNDTFAPAQTTLGVASQTGRSLTLSFAAPGDDGFAGTAADYDFYFVNPSLGVRVLMPTSAVPAAGGTQQQVSVNTPLRNLSGTVEMIAYDERGNASTSSLAVNVQQNPGTDPYVVTQSAAEPLSTDSSNRLPLDGDDKYHSTSLPIVMQFYGQPLSAVTVSTNGVIYFSTPPRREPSGDADDVPSSVEAMQGQAMIAGLWDDLEIDTSKRADAGVFVVRPDVNRIIYRWQGTTFPTPLSTGGNRGVHPVNFEIELHAGGTITMRYGSGNQNLFPVVGVSGGEPSAYVVDSHTSENALKNLTNAQTVTFAPRTTSAPGQAVLQFNTASFAQSEAAGQAVLTVARSGDQQAAGSVEVRTVDNTSAVRCDDTTTLPGVAFARCDYATTVETLSFAAGEPSKTVVVPLINDGHVEPNETVTLVLSSPAGNAVLGAQTTLTLTITSDDAAGAANPLDNTSFFVRQQYLDFLSREPEQGEPWTAVLLNCPNQFNRDKNNPSSACDRNLVSSAFFRSQEFELKGRYVFHFYVATLGRLPTYDEIAPDMRRVTGTTPAETFQKRAQFAEAWLSRPDFAAQYGSLSNADFVALLLSRYNQPGGLQSIRTPNPATPDDQNAKITITRQELIDRLNSATYTRAQVVRAVADSDEVSAAEFQRAFVAMQYYGYLRRTPDEDGFNAWLNYLRANPTDFYTMVDGFASSQEYRLRFGRE